VDDAEKDLSDEFKRSRLSISSRLRALFHARRIDGRLPFVGVSNWKISIQFILFTDLVPMECKETGESC
jgi:hypothetical protein